jgi:hypothetical protein
METETKIWIEGDMFGGAHVMVQHQNGRCEPFEYCTFNYNYMYTDNSGVRSAAERMAVSLGATESVEYRVREFKLSNA